MPTDETQEARRPVKILRMNRLTQAQRTDLIQIGQRMSNLLYNMKQSPNVPADWRKSGEELQEQWDAIRYPEKAGE